MWSRDWIFVINDLDFMLYIYLIWWVEKESFGIVKQPIVPTRHSKNKTPNTIVYHSQFLKVGFLIYNYL